MSTGYYDASRITAERASRAIRSGSSIKRTTAASVPAAALPLEPITGLKWYITPLTLEWTPPVRKVASYLICMESLTTGTKQVITTYRPIYTISGANEGDVYIFHVSVKYDNGESTSLSTPAIWIPPTELTTLLTRAVLSPILTNESAFVTIFHTALSRNLNEIGLCKWMTAVMGAWHWITPLTARRISGVWNGWNWNPYLSGPELKIGEKLCWLCYTINEIDGSLFNKTPLFRPSEAVIRSIKSKCQFSLWWNTCKKYLTSPVSLDPPIDGSWSEPDDTQYPRAITRMLNTRSSMTPLDEKKMWFLSSDTWKPWIWLTMEWCRCAKITINQQIGAFMDLIYGMEQSRKLIQSWPLRDSPMTWIRSHLADEFVSASRNNTIRGYSWSSESAQLTATYLSPITLYGFVFSTVMNKWFQPVSNAYPIQYHYIHGAVPFRDGNSEDTLYGSFDVGLTDQMIFSSWDDYSREASKTALWRGEGIDCAIDSAQTIANRIITSYISIINTKEEDIPVLPSTKPVVKPAVVPASLPVVPASPPVVTPPVTKPTVTPIPIPIPKPITPMPVEPYRISVEYLSITPPLMIQNLITQAITFIQSVVVQTHGHRLSEVSTVYDMIVDVDVQSLSPSILASSRPTIVNDKVVPAIPVRQLVTLNSASFSSLSYKQSQLNGSYVPSIVPILIHEMLHGMGIASYITGTKIIGWDQMLDSTKTWYTGNQRDSEAIRAYQRAVGTMVQRIPIENSFGSGTAYSHWEEGLKDGFVSEKRYYDYGYGPVYHPSLPYEIMSGVAGSVYYFTDITAGALKDHGYVVNMNSPSVVPYPKQLIS